MRKLLIVAFMPLGLSLHAANFTPGNVAVVQAAGVATTGNAVSLLEIRASDGTVVQTIPLNNLFVGQSIQLGYDMSLSGDGALVCVPGYAATATGIETTTAASDNRVIGTVKWDATYTRPIVNSAAVSGQLIRGVASDGFTNFWFTFTSGMRYVTPSAPTVSTTVSGTGSRACAVFNSQVYVSVNSALDSTSVPYPTGAASYVGYISGGTANNDGFAIPPGPTTGSIAYIGTYNTTATIYAFQWNGSSWNAPYVLTFSGISGLPEHLAVDYSKSPPVIYFTTSTGTALYKISDPGITGTYAPTTLYTPTSPANLRGLTMAPTQPALPSFVTCPSNTTNNPGDTVTFGPVSATGANPNAYTWLANYGSGIVLLTNGPTGHGSSVIGGANTVTLAITNVAAGDVGSYYAVASNNGGTNSCAAATLTFYPSCLSTALASITNTAGSTATFSVASGVGGCQAPLTYQWFYNGLQLFDGPGPSGVSTVSGATNATMSVANVQDGDAGGSPGAPGSAGSVATYSVTVFDKNNTPSSSSATLTLLDLPVITIEPQDVTIAAGQTARFTNEATGGSVFYQWYKNGTNAMNNGPTGSGSTVSGAQLAIMSIANAQDADAAGYTVVVTNLAGGATSAPPAVLIVGHPPCITSAPANVTAWAGSNVSFTVGTGCGPPTSYVWKLNGATLADDGIHIFGSTTATLWVTNITDLDARTYSVTAANQYGSAGSSAFLTVIQAAFQGHPGSNEVPNQVVFEPFNYGVQPYSTPGGVPTYGSGYTAWSAYGVIGIYNELTGVGLTWTNTVASSTATFNQDMRIDSTYNNSTDSACDGESYPWPELASVDPNEIYMSPLNAGGAETDLPLGTGGSISNGTVYFSILLHWDQGTNLSGPAYSPLDFQCGFATGSPGGGKYNTGIYLMEPGDDTIHPGVFKTSGGLASLNAGVNGNWAAKACHRGQIVFAVCRLTIGPGTNDDTLDLWLNPCQTSFYAGETNLPPADVSSAGAGAPDVGNVDYFYIKIAGDPFSRRYTDLRIGRTWASVTPRVAPTLWFALNNVTAAAGATVPFPSKNAGNAVDTYQWQLNGGAPLTDDGLHIFGSSTATLWITNVQSADVGTYTVTGTNTDPLYGTNHVGSASATLTVGRPVLTATYSAPNVILTWSTNFSGFTLEQTPAINPPVWTTNSNPPYTILGTNYSVTVSTAPLRKFFRLIQ